MSASELSEENCYVALTHDELDSKSMMDRVRSPKAGAIVLFAGKLPLSDDPFPPPLTLFRHH